MKFHPRLVVGILALALIPSLAPAAESSLMQWVRGRINAEVVQPLEARQASRFSRSRPPPRERRVRLLSQTSQSDAKGGKFVPFAVDLRYGKEWQDDILGCVYKGSGKVFVKRGDEYRPAAFLLGKNVKAAPGVCMTAPEQT